MDFFLKNYEAGKQVVLIVDEAQHLTVEMLEELRLLSNLNGTDGKAVHVVLLAQSTFGDTLKLPEMVAFARRLGGRAELETLELHEAADYLVHQLRVAGGQPEEIISDEALEVLARGAQGIPCLLNRAAHQAFLLAVKVGASAVDAEVALEALSLLRLADAQENPVDAVSPHAPTEEEDPEQVQPPAAATASNVGLTRESVSEQEANPDAEFPSNVSRSRRLFASPRRPA
jgi:hypothetical protein